MPTKNTKLAGELRDGDKFRYLGRTHRVSGQLMHHHRDGRTTIQTIVPGGERDEMTVFADVRFAIDTD